jgi:ABC-type dipeptide/oligopeptide/nickel transport system permease component
LPLLFTGALLLERLFQIPGFGNLLVDAIHSQDQPVVMFITYSTSVLYLVMLIVTDIAYTIVDPRVSL